MDNRSIDKYDLRIRSFLVDNKSLSQKEIDKHNDSLTDQSENMEEIIFEDTEEAETE
ncbi:hypothetical protein HN450_05500 [bacterium]|jgi:hypothetical protein|nr:hypothetical protein [bacterium]MBT3850535.1 hypothetical protein [bacterium]MBT4435639.1 hypothetical protein [bacterium]MDG2445945.1 hypothetical protein [Thermodesulfobacteriota bacterium]